MMASKLQGKISVERMCQLAGVSRAGYYRHWQATAPRREDNGLRDALQRLALAEPHYGYRRLGVLLRQKGWHANHKRVLRLMREDNLLCLRKSPFVPMTTNATHDWCIVPNLASADRYRPALGCRHHLPPSRRGVRIPGGCLGRFQPKGHRMGGCNPSQSRACH